MNYGIQLPMVKMVGNKYITTMKNFRLIYALLAATLFITACSDEELINEGRVPAADGSEIIFGGRAGFENSDNGSRTIYTGVTYTHGGKTYERIDWIDGDKIEIYSPEASNGPSSHYKITSFTTGDENEGTSGKGSDYAYLERLNESSLQWNGDGDHTFYAMYPSASMFVNEDGTINTNLVMTNIPKDYFETDITAKLKIMYTLSDGTVCTLEEDAFWSRSVKQVVENIMESSTATQVEKDYATNLFRTSIDKDVYEDDFFD